MGGDRADGDGKLLGNLAVRHPLRQASQHLYFTLSQRAVVGGSLGGCLISCISLRAMVGWRTLSPRETVRMASSRYSADESLSKKPIAPALIAAYTLSSSG